MRKSIFILLLCASSIAGASSEYDEKIQALKTIIKYSETIACNTIFEDKKSIKRLIKNVFTVYRDSELGGSTYYVLWGGI